VDHANLLLELMNKRRGIGFVPESIYHQSHFTSSLAPIPFLSRQPAPKQSIYIISLKKNRQHETRKIWLELLQEQPDPVREKQYPKIGL
jgi:hypothetical protein